jgi:hypothetical protein
VEKGGGGGGVGEEKISWNLFHPNLIGLVIG